MVFFYIFVNSMKKILIGLLIISSSVTSYSQYKVDYGFRVGAANYLGDIGGKEQTRRDFIWDIKMQKTRWAAGGFYRYRFNKNFAVNAGLTYARIAGDDALSTNKGRRGRNLSFINDILDSYVRAEFYFYSHDDVTGRGKYFLSMKAYGFAGFGGTFHAPKTKDSGNSITKLRPEQTEGIKYGIATANIPVGLGLYFTKKKEHRFGFEMGWSATFTDYLDDVSGVYSAESTSQLSNRYDEIPTEELGNVPSLLNYQAGDKRGDATNNDNYLIASFTYSYVLLGSKSNTLYRQHSGKAKYKRNTKRRIRAKF